MAILALMRSGGSLAVAAGVVSGPLYRAISLDLGQTWGVAERVADRGVAPTIAEPLPDVLVAAYGRPGNWLMFSTDRGVSFFGHWCYRGEAIGTQYDGGEYDSLVVVPTSSEKQCSQIMVTWANCTSKTSCASMGTFVTVCKI